MIDFGPVLDQILIIFDPNMVDFGTLWYIFLMNSASFLVHVSSINSVWFLQLSATISAAC